MKSREQTATKASDTICRNSTKTLKLLQSSFPLSIMVGIEWFVVSQNNGNNINVMEKSESTKKTFDHEHLILIKKIASETSNHPIYLFIIDFISSKTKITIET